MSSTKDGSLTLTSDLLKKSNIRFRIQTLYLNPKIQIFLIAFLNTFARKKNAGKVKQVDLEYIISSTDKNYPNTINLRSNNYSKVKSDTNTFNSKSKVDNKQFESGNYLLQILLDTCCLNRKNILKSCLYTTTKKGTALAKYVS